jgi:hypothetical protein
MQVRVSKRNLVSRLAEPVIENEIRSGKVLRRRVGVDESGNVKVRGRGFSYKIVGGGCVALREDLLFKARHI